MITPTVIAISLFAASLPVLYLLIIHRSLSGGAANDPNFDVDAKLHSASPRQSSAKAHAAPSHTGTTPKHA
ncbi:MAG: hypothetical protein JNN07_02220 [Verrucomicrobiales bacterium]|nr:hypothetical protein [Verrucomicrobiales bacterium]